MNSYELLISFIFYLCTGLILISAIFTVLSKKIVHSVLFSLITFLSIGILFFLLNAEYNAVVQISIFGVGIPILFVLAIMFTSEKVDTLTFLSFSPRFMISIITGFLFVLVLFNILLISSSVINWLFTPQTSININHYEMFDLISKGLYINFIIAFELVALLVLLVIIGLSTIGIIKEKKRG